ncbi:unnamed protein product [Urochloa humidicola]
MQHTEALPQPPPMDAAHDPVPLFSPLSSDAALSRHFPSVAVHAADALDLSFTSTPSASTSLFTTTTTFSARSLFSLSSSSTSLFPYPHSSAASPHRAHLAAARAATDDGVLHLARLHLICELAHGYLAHVFLCRLKSSPPPSPLFALKVIDLCDDDLSRVLLALDSVRASSKLG